MKAAAAGPFLKWVGGKRQLLPTLLASVPQDVALRRYVDPFLGGGSLFFALQPNFALLGDANHDLIETYIQVRDRTDDTRLELKRLIAEHSVDQYYAVRNLYNLKRASPHVQAARFIYLNMTCFNGVFRVNAKGLFNVPKGSKDDLREPDAEHFEAVAKSLRRVELCPLDYEQVLAKTTGSDFVYLDPPYPPLNRTAYFTHYTKDRFGKEQQEKVAACARSVDKLGAPVLASNADLPEIRELYSGFRLRSVPVRRFINCKGIRSPVSELILTNY